MSRIGFIAVFIFIMEATSAQTRVEDRMLGYQWLTIGVNARISARWSATFLRQYSRPDDWSASPDYYLDDVRLQRDLGKHWSVFGGISYLVNNPGSKDPGTKRRYIFGLGWQTKLISDLRLSNRITAERHLQENRYDGRVVATVRLDYTGLVWFKTVNVRPFAAGQLYYFLGGNWIKQYDATGEFVRRSPTYGLHRARVRCGLTVSPCHWLQLSGFYLVQREFNTAHAVANHHQINEINPSTGNITRPFDQYQVWGAGLTFIIGSRKKNKQRPDTDSSGMD